MVSLETVRSSNSRIASTIPAGLVAVFIGATSGIGEYTLKKFAEYALRPRVYFVGRSQEAGNRITTECKVLNPEGDFVFIKADTSVIRTVDRVCEDIKSKENAINLLFLSSGTLATGQKTPEKLHLVTSLAYYSRTRFILNLLPLIQEATALRRVVSVLAAAKEGPIDMTDFQAWKLSMFAARGHVSSMITLSLEALAKEAPGVSFIHDYPGFVKSKIMRHVKGLKGFAMNAVVAIIGPFRYIPPDESGERHLYLATSTRYPAGECGADGVPLDGAVAVARGTDGKIGSGVYSIDEKGESSDPQTEELLSKLRSDGTADRVWEHTQAEFERITKSYVT